MTPRPSTANHRQTAGYLVASAWEQVLGESPVSDYDEYWQPSLKTYRERLDRVRMNYRGEPIPRITLVRRNLWRKPRQWPPRLPA